MAEPWRSSGALVARNEEGISLLIVGGCLCALKNFLRDPLKKFLRYFIPYFISQRE